jgi:hypothetical protein
MKRSATCLSSWAPWRFAVVLCTVSLVAGAHTALAGIRSPRSVLVETDAARIPADTAVDVTGEYTGTAQPTKGNAVALSVTFSQNGTTVTGTMSVSPSSCLLSLSFSGTVSATMLSGSFTDGKSTINISATVSGNQMTGTFSIPVSPCAKGSGTFTLTRVSLLTPTPTATATSTATPTATPIPCVGDCNADGAVTVDELLTLVNIALGNADVSTCLPGDANHDMQITIDEILTAVNNALNGCPSA